jgi:succinate-semialdehyde dehydrogenase/glutarate-semialdehyde dehydrogenase
MYQSYGLFIDGRWRQAADAATLPVVDPATEEEIGAIPVATPADLDDALRAAESGFQRWRRVSVNERAACLRRLAEGIRAREDEIARTITLEMGKPLAEARAEVLATADQFEWNAEEAKRIYGHTLDGRQAGVRYSVRFEPVGVVAAFTPWNFPVLLPARKLAPALAAGCSVVIKPAEEAPGASFAVARIAAEAGLPAGVLNVVTGEPAKISTHLITSPIVRKVTFTGSVSVGKQLMKLAAEGMKKVSFELGGHAPVIIFDDADPERAAAACVRAKFRNAGQVCISPSRFYVHRALAEPFRNAFAAIASALKVGSGIEPGVEMGPLANRRRLEAARAFVEDARAGGAKLLAGGGPPAAVRRGYFFSPTVLSDLAEDARMLSEEPFVPVAPLLGFEDFDEVIGRANALPFGLAAYLFTDRLRTAERAAEALEAGMVGINDFALAASEAPFGGVKESGIGREGGSFGIREYLEPKTVKTVI